MNGINDQRAVKLLSNFPNMCNHISIIPGLAAWCCGQASARSSGFRNRPKLSRTILEPAFYRPCHSRSKVCFYLQWRIFSNRHSSFSPISIATRLRHRNRRRNITLSTLTSGFVSAIISVRLSKYLQPFVVAYVPASSSPWPSWTCHEENQSREPQSPFGSIPIILLIFIMAIVTVGGFNAFAVFHYLAKFPSPLPYAITDGQ